MAFKTRAQFLFRLGLIVNGRIREGNGNGVEFLSSPPSVLAATQFRFRR
jgi:hypothetical protein